MKAWMHTRHWINGQSELSVRERVLVATENSSLIRQRQELADRVPHLLGCALEEPAAAQREQRIGAEQCR